jgi:hypothetical protein
MTAMADGVKRTNDGKMFVTIAGADGSSTPVGAPGFSTALAQSNTAVSGAGDTNENTLATITIPANTLGANGGVLLKAWVAQNNSAGTKTWRVRYSGAAGTIYFTTTATTQTSAFFEVWIGNDAATNAQRGSSHGIIGTALVGAATGTSAVDTTAATTILITAQKNTGGDTMTLNNYVATVQRVS